MAEEALHNQIHPHFLLNALATIQTFVRDRPRLAEELIDSLARYGHRVLTRRGPVFLVEEVMLVQLYLALERVRLGGRLRTIFDLDPMALGVTVPSLLLQPLVENAVIHAASRRGVGATVRVAVRHSRKARRVVMMVADDGPGLERGPPSVPDDSEKRAGGGRPQRHQMGLRTVRLRLEMAYGAAGRLRLLRRSGGGTIAALIVPEIAPIVRHLDHWPAGNPLPDGPRAGC